MVKTALFDNRAALEEIIFLDNYLKENGREMLMVGRVINQLKSQKITLDALLEELKKGE
jgi:hypothetical protein